MLRKIRIIIAIICFVLITLLFLDFTGALHHWFGWLAKIQLLPALLALNIGVIIFLVLLTFLLGRVYCSAICPLGVFQDIISWAAGKREKLRFSFSPALKWLRYGVLVIFCIALITGISSIVSLLEPYSAYGRIASNLFVPIYQWINNVFAYFAERVDSYTFYSVDVWMKSAITFIIASVTLVIIFILAWRNGRTYCNTICPVGTVLGFISKFSLFKPRFNTSKCINCKLCERACKASCINVKEHKIDYSRCVSCMDCLNSCKFGAMNYQLKSKSLTTKNEENIKPNEKPGTSRREFLSVAAAFAVTSTLKAQERGVDGGLALIEDKKIPDRQTPIKPPGSLNARNFTQHCTACQLCMSVCPNQILRPASKLSNFMQPEMSYERGYCRPECTKCSEVCPTKAIRHITTAEKSAIQIGHAVWIKENCVVNTDDVTCRSCERNCPVGAIQLVARDTEDSESLKIPTIDTERCIGCGACENLCPARPFSAIYVEGHISHRIV